MKPSAFPHKVVAELIGALALILSLIFVGLEIQQNTRTAQVSAYQDLIEKVTLLVTRAGDDPEFAAFLFGDAWSELPSTLPELSPEERRHLDEFMWLVVRHGDMSYYQFDRGLLNAERLASAAVSLRNTLEHPLAQAWWDDARDNFVADYQTHVDSLIATTS